MLVVECLKGRIRDGRLLGNGRWFSEGGGPFVQRLNLVKDDLDRWGKDRETGREFCEHWKGRETGQGLTSYPACCESSLRKRFMMETSLRTKSCPLGLRM